MGILSDRQIRAEVGIEPFDPGTRKPGTISSGLGSYGYDVRLGYKFKVFSPIHATVIDPKNFDPKCLVDVDLTPAFYAHSWEEHPKDSGNWSCMYCGQVNKGTNCLRNPVKMREPDHLLIPPHSFVLAESLEKFDIPRDVLCIVVGKSTYARCGLIVNVTPGEPEWAGYWTIELSNTTPLPVKVYPGEGIMQCMFFRSDERAEVVERHLDNSVGYLRTGTQSYAHALSKDLEGASCEVSYADRKGKYQNQGGLTLPIAQPPEPPPPPGWGSLGDTASPASPTPNDVGRLE